MTDLNLKLVIVLTLTRYVVLGDKFVISVLVIVVFVVNEFSATSTMYPVIASPPVSDGGDH